MLQRLAYGYPLSGIEREQALHQVQEETVNFVPGWEEFL